MWWEGRMVVEANLWLVGSAGAKTPWAIRPDIAWYRSKIRRRNLADRVFAEKTKGGEADGTVTGTMDQPFMHSIDCALVRTDAAPRPLEKVA